MIETTRHYKLNRAPRYYRPRASACRRAPPAEWTSRSVGRRVPQRSSKCAVALWEALARAERPPLWGSDDVSAMRNYRYRHRDSPYVAKRSGERTSRAGRPWAVGGELPGARWRGRPVCARCGRLCKGQRRHKRARVGFFHPHPPSVAARGTAAGRKGGPISSASGYFSSLCWSWGRRTRRRRREAARARRGERHRPCGAARRVVRRGAKRIAQRGLRLAQQGDLSRRRGRQPSASRRFGRGESHAHPFERGHKGQGEHEATADVE